MLTRFSKVLQNISCTSASAIIYLKSNTVSELRFYFTLLLLGRQLKYVRAPVLKLMKGTATSAPARTRRFITNVMIQEVDPDEIVVAASAMVYRFRLGEAAPYVGSYHSA
jgi:hypothetical protein